MKQPIALITGASGGIGGAAALAFAKEGYALGLQYHNNRAGAEAIVNLLPQGTPYLLLPCDLNDTDAVEKMVCSLHKMLGNSTVLVHCAGVAPRQMLFTDTDDALMRTVFETDVYSVLRLTRLLSDDLRKTHGNIITISSVWGVTGGSCEVLYSAAKAALIGFTKALAKELAPSGVRVNCIAPGFIDTPMNAHLDAAAVEDFRLSTPLERLGSPSDVAQAALYLAKADFVTGQILSVDGGIAI